MATSHSTSKRNGASKAPRPRAPWWARALDTTADLVRAVGSVAALVLVLGALLVALEANPDNAVVRWLLEVGTWLLGPLQDLFTPEDPTVAVVVNHAVGALVWAGGGWLLARLLRPAR